MFRVNTRGAFLCCREAANRLPRGGGGRIIAVTSSMVAQRKPGFAAYVGSKAAVEAMVTVLAKELAGTGITANCNEAEVARVAAECPMGRIGRPHDIANVVGFLASASGEWVNGQVVRVNGGVA
ncbi:unnamed protein product [Spirodela intermedia]|uniref:Uncharacterized protein n=1 Tax=Spirodela intermedia TaxID=51605 RepID=A0A7I8JCC9_SPIIN|nr:unnamed protein product [Spirodela intermedia]CAA6667153.1 unnamed protein product [Spirodela intermedia]